jgi:hypothetical protein
MDGTALYDADILAWSEQQAAALRKLAGRRDLPNELDLETVAEEIEDLGNSELRAVESLAGNILIHLVMLWADPDGPAIRGWRGDIAAWRVALRRRLSPSMVGKIDMNALWRDAVEVACARPSDWDGGKAVQAKAKLDGFPCPFDLPGLIAETADVPAVLAKLPR